MVLENVIIDIGVCMLNNLAEFFYYTLIFIQGIISVLGRNFLIQVFILLSFIGIVIFILIYRKEKSNFKKRKTSLTEEDINEINNYKDRG